MTDTERLFSAYYIKVLAVNLATDEFTALCLDNDERIRSYNFTDWMRIFAEEGNVPEEMKEQFMNFFDKKAILQSLETKDEIVGHYLRKCNKTSQWLQADAKIFKSTKWTEDNPIVIVAISSC